MAYVWPTAKELKQFYDRVRIGTEKLVEGLQAEDTVVQTMPDVSPTKWHLAHTTWFFETFVLARKKSNYSYLHPGFDYLFNSYYNSIGPMHERPSRGHLSRPTLKEVMAYRREVDLLIRRVCDQGLNDEMANVLMLGCHHERQHQELMITDLKHVFSENPLVPIWRDLPSPNLEPPRAVQWINVDGGLVEVGATSSDFAFDCEVPRHRVWMDPYLMADRPVTNSDYLSFIKDDGYQRPELWLSDGWRHIRQDGWQRPLYWCEDLEHEFTVGGVRQLEPSAPVAHVSFYEAEAYARWAGARLPTEFEWEHIAETEKVQGDFSDSGRFHPSPIKWNNEDRWFSLWGNVWEWTASAFCPYPGFVTRQGALGEYNGKFMSGQMVLRGGSVASAADHLRASYRNFFYPHQRWQFSGLRLARTA